MTHSGYYGYTEGELVIKVGCDGTVGVQLQQKCKKRPKRYGYRFLENGGRTAAHDERPLSKVAIIQAMRYHFGVQTTRIAKLVGVMPQYVSMVTVTSAGTFMPWWRRKRQVETIEAARKLLQCP